MYVCNVLKIIVLFFYGNYLSFNNEIFIAVLGDVCRPTDLQAHHFGFPGTIYIDFCCGIS